MSLPERRRYLLAGLLACGTCGRRMESAWSHGRPPTGAATGTPAPLRPTRASQGTPTSAKTAPCRSCPPLSPADKTEPPEAHRRRRTRGGTDACPAASPEDVIGFLRANETALTYDLAIGTLRAAATGTAKTITGKAS